MSGFVIGPRGLFKSNGEGWFFAVICVPDRRLRGFLELLLFSRNTGPAHTHTYTYTHTRAHIHMHTYTHIQTYTQIHTNTHIHTHVHTHTYTHTHTHTGAYTCTHACAQMTTDHKEVLFF